MGHAEAVRLTDLVPSPALAAYDRGESPPGAQRLRADGDPFEVCPFTPLGNGAGRYWFLSCSGELVDLPPSLLATWAVLVDLCGGDCGWLTAYFPQYDRDGKLAGFSARDACAAIMRRSFACDIFDSNIARRRYGFWKLGDGYALHLGDQIEWCGAPRRAGFIEGGVLWLRLSSRPTPAEPASVEIGRQLETLLNTWNWRHASSSSVLLGLAVSGWIAGALEWRPHGFITGESGTGKTTLLRDLVAALCPLTHFLNHYTEPGLRQLLTESAISVVLDEAEADTATEQRLLRVVEMLRRASSGSGVRSVMGSVDHVARQFTLSGSAIMGAIFLPPLEPQDVSRFTVLKLLPLDPDSASKTPPAAFATRHGMALWGRAIAAAPRILWLIRLLQARIVARGYPSRLADQLATIAACRWVMVREASDDPGGIDAEDGIDEPLAIVEHLLVDEIDRITDGAGSQALGRLLMSALDMAGDKKTLGQVLARTRMLRAEIDRAAQDVDAANFVTENRAELRKLDTLLEAHGVRWGLCERARSPHAQAPPWGLFVVVASHPRLERVFADTAWSGRRWGAALRQLPGALGSSDAGTQRIGGVKVRVVWVPALAFDAPEDGGT